MSSYNIHADVEQLQEVAAVQAPTAVVFYCARILEAMFAEVEETIFGERSAQFYASLVRLNSAALMSDHTLYYCHAARRLGNDVRHVLRDIDAVDASIALSLLDKGLHWYVSGKQLWNSRSDVEEVRKKLPQSRPVRDLMTQIESLIKTGVTSVKLEALLASEAFFHSPIFASLVAEQLIAAGGIHVDQAIQLLEKSAGSFAGYCRHRQLYAWALRLRGRYAECLNILSSLQEENANDPETLGLLAATYKRLWSWDGAPPVKGKKEHFANRAAELYLKAWQASRERETYTGINAATMSLLTGKEKRARQIAGQIIRLYESRQGLLASSKSICFSGYWDRVTLAEAELLAGNVDEARRHYRNAFALHARWPTYRQSTVDQLALLLPCLGIAESALCFAENAMEKSTLPPRKNQMYKPKQVDTKEIEFPEELIELREIMAENIHEAWATNRMAQGWKFGPERNDHRLEHPGLVPYEELSEIEKEYDRHSAEETIKVLLKLGYRIERPF